MGGYQEQEQAESRSKTIREWASRWHLCAPTGGQLSASCAVGNCPHGGRVLGLQGRPGSEGGHQAILKPGLLPPKPASKNPPPAPLAKGPLSFWG